MNPMAQAIQDARFNLVTQDTITAQSLVGGSWYIVIPFAITILVLIGGILYFKKQSRTFAENI
jgi:ABC-2 type transport system permease protein